MDMISNKFHQRALNVIILVILVGIALKLEIVGPTFSSFNLCPSIAIGDRKQF